ncbi:MAG: CRISPR-associated endonuclease Cas2 [Armatimonadetes bacterium]|nr:CRISPR-associated endonuclease Cas2 [Armatimonadota bacterium]
MRADYLISYDVNTEDAAGRKRLRKASKQCVNYGTRVQYSVFELSLTDVELEELRHRLLQIIDADKDSLRIYSLPGGRKRCVETFGVDKYVDFTEPLIT